MARSRSRDIDEIIKRIRALRPDVSISQLQVAHAADDDGLWFFGREGGRNGAQLESSSGNCPFLVESDRDDTRYEARSVEEAAALVLRLIDG